MPLTILRIAEKAGEARRRKSGDLPGSSVLTARIRSRNRVRDNGTRSEKRGTAADAVFFMFSSGLHHGFRAYSFVDAQKNRAFWQLFLFIFKEEYEYDQESL